MGFPVLRGFDVVEYFSLVRGQKGVHGSREIRSIYKGFTFFFSSEKNKAAFEANPARYMPQFGGFCAWGIGRELTIGWGPTRMGPDSDPLDAWLIADDELVLVHDPDVVRYMSSLCEMVVVHLMFLASCF
jgi:YHS domain-containing protein